MTERQYLGITSNAVVILDENGEVLTMTGQEWKAYKADGGDVESVGCLPAHVTGVTLVR